MTDLLARLAQLQSREQYVDVCYENGDVIVSPLSYAEDQRDLALDALAAIFEAETGEQHHKAATDAVTILAALRGDHSASKSLTGDT